MVHSSCHVVGILTSLFRRGYERIPPEEKEEVEQVQTQDGCKSVLCEGCMKAMVECEEERDGEGPEGCGDRLMARCRLQIRSGTSFACWKDLHDASYMYTLAGSWRKAIHAYGELAAYSLRRGSELSAGSALLRAAKCYAEIEDKGAEEFAAMKLSLEEALALFAKNGDLRLCATACSDLAEFHMEHNDFQNALLFYQRAAKYHGTTNRRANQFYSFRAQLVACLLANEEALRANGVLPIHDYKRNSTAGYMKPSDPDWSLMLDQLLDTTSITHD
ncbi:hypothetical protein VPH35_088226 [Triticum aestivum]|uniref:uncharacterized protein n=1 Tax=Triticum aestivum TaxID=4565 RepID=UPI001D032AF2|nr:uncharacterized protein LOC123115675 [Triticum aestivum]